MKNVWWGKLQSGKQLAIRQFCQTIGIVYDSALVLQEDLQNIQLPNTYYTDIEAALPNRAEYQLLQQSVKAEQLQAALENTGKFKNIFMDKGKKIKNSETQFSIRLIY